MLGEEYGRGDAGGGGGREQYVSLRRDLQRIFFGPQSAAPVFPTRPTHLATLENPRRPRIHGFPDIENSVFIRLSFTGHVS